MDLAAVAEVPKMFAVDENVNNLSSSDAVACVCARVCVYRWLRRAKLSRRIDRSIDGNLRWKKTHFICFEK